MSVFASRLFLPFLLLLGTTVLPAHGEPSGPTETSPEEACPARPLRAPRFIGPAPVSLRTKLTSSQDLALERLRTAPACRELFAPFLGNDELNGGLANAVVAHLAASLYRADNDRNEARICRERSAAAFTVQGSSVTYVCSRAFNRLGRSRGAAILIHEALHRAGLGEKPLDPEAQTSQQIDRMVRRCCEL
jgi:hypothetical protein